MPEPLLAAGVIGGIALLIGAVLGLATGAVRTSTQSPADNVNALLPQSQCGQCGFPGCRPYAEAIVAGGAAIDQCAPGGNATVTALAKLLGRQTGRVNRAFGEPGPAGLAFIDENACIGCALCIEACPVDAIVGAAKYSHTVIAGECTGCELCVPVCPVDCISITGHQA